MPGEAVGILGAAVDADQAGHIEPVKRGSIAKASIGRSGGAGACASCAMQGIAAQSDSGAASRWRPGRIRLTRFSGSFVSAAR